MISENFIYLAALIHLCATAVYAYATLKGKTKPNRVSWFMWALAPLIASAAQIQGGIGLSTLMVFMTGFGPLVIFLCSFANPKAYWKISVFDYVCGSLSFLAILIWCLTKSFNMAIILTILSDFLAAVPTYKKAYTDPASENGPTYVLGFLACFLGIFCVQQQGFTAYGFISYLTLLYATLSFLVYRKRLKKFLKRRVTL